MISKVSFNFSNLYHYPVIDIFKHEGYVYHSKYVSLLSNFKAIQENKKSVYPQQLKPFLIDQLKFDQETLEPQKEVLFIGRSNVGKSSLINLLIGVKDAQNVSKKPGSTKKLYFHHFPKLGYIVDAPGYGYSKVSKKAVDYWQGMIMDYVKYSSRLSRIYLLLDVEHGMKNNDQLVMSMLENQHLNVQVVLTKCDKIKDHQLFDRQLYFAHQLQKYKFVSPLLHCVSSHGKLGVDELKYSLIDAFMVHQKRNLMGMEDQLIKRLQARKRPSRLDLHKESKAWGSRLKLLSNLKEKPQLLLD